MIGGSLMKTFLTGVGYFIFGLLSLLILFTVFQGWAQKLDSRWFSTVGFLLITALTVLFWKKMSLWSRVHLLVAYLIVLIGGMALYFSPEAKESFKLGKL